MKMDVYKQFDLQDPDTGAIKREWQYHRTVACHAKGVISNSATTRSSDKQVFDNKYSNDQVVQIRTAERLAAREKITNTRNKDGIVIWKEQNYPTETPTVFEVVGITPITDPFGTIIGYNSSMKRSENQQIGL
jgi:Zn ribbon nucleic-acid-binding protein